MLVIRISRPNVRRSVMNIFALITKLIMYFCIKKPNTKRSAKEIGMDRKGSI